MSENNFHDQAPYHAVHVDLIPSRTEISSLGQTADLLQELSRPFCHFVVRKSQLTGRRLVSEMFEWRRLEACHEGWVGGCNRGSVTGCVNLQKRVNASLPCAFGQQSHYLKLNETDLHELHSQ